VIYVTYGALDLARREWHTDSARSSSRSVPPAAATGIRSTTRPSDERAASVGLDDDDLEVLARLHHVAATTADRNAACPLGRDR
jgi:hypothetical protein